MIFLMEEVRPQLISYYEQTKDKFQAYHGRPNNCSRLVKTFLETAKADVEGLTPWADTIRNVGPVFYNKNHLIPGDIVAMGRPGDTSHVGVYLGENNVLHQSASRGYSVGVYGDLAAFTNYYRGFYFVRPSYNLPFNQEPMVAPDIPNVA